MDGEDDADEDDEKVKDELCTRRVSFILVDRNLSLTLSSQQQQLDEFKVHQQSLVTIYALTLAPLFRTLSSSLFPMILLILFHMKASSSLVVKWAWSSCPSHQKLEETEKEKRGNHYTASTPLPPRLCFYS